jgi:ADP-ribosylglycohydrolase
LKEPPPVPLIAVAAQLVYGFFNGYNLAQLADPRCIGLLEAIGYFVYEPVESHFVGSVVGLAVGDALGYPAEFRRRTQLLSEIGPDGITDFISLKDPRFSRPFFTGPDHPPGTFTDDTQMTIAVAESLLDAGRADLDHLMREMGGRFVTWSCSEKNNRAPGATCMEGCGNLARGVHWRDAGVAESKGCGSAMRVAPIGLYYNDLDQVAEVARASSLLTHGHPAALEAAAAGAIMVALALVGAGPEQIHAEVIERCCERSADFAASWRKVPALLPHLPEKVLSKDGLGEGWVAEEAVASAMYCFWRSPDDFREAIHTAINTDGDSDSIGTITGSVIGARLGISAIPASWRDTIEDSKYLHDLGTKLWMERCI